MRPVVPEADWLLAHMLRWFSTAISSFMCVGNVGGDSEEVVTARGCTVIVASLYMHDHLPVSGGSS